MLVSIFQQSESYVNPALLLSWQLKQLEIQNQLTLETIISLQPIIELAIALGEKEQVTTKITIDNLISASPIPSPIPILGI